MRLRSLFLPWAETDEVAELIRSTLSMYPRKDPESDDWEFGPEDLFDTVQRNASRRYRIHKERFWKAKAVVGREGVIGSLFSHTCDAFRVSVLMIEWHELGRMPWPEESLLFQYDKALDDRFNYWWKGNEFGAKRRALKAKMQEKADRPAVAISWFTARSSERPLVDGRTERIECYPHTVAALRRLEELYGREKARRASVCEDPIILENRSEIDKLRNAGIEILRIREMTVNGD
jgi:hypothetical protein